jgi:hypothetical protein
MNAIATKKEVLLRALGDRVQPPVAAQPSERAFNRPADPSGNELSVAAARDGLDGDAKCLTGLGQPLASVAEITQRRTLEAVRGRRAQDRHDALRVMPVRRRDVDRQRDGILVDRDSDLDAADLLAALEATRC